MKARRSAIGLVDFYWPSSGVVISVGANSYPTSHQLPKLAYSVYQILQKAGALHVS